MTHRIALGALALALLAPTASGQTADAAEDPALVQRYQATITPAELAGHLYVYADDYMAGRDTGEPGQRFAAKYLAGQYQAMGMRPRAPALERTTTCTPTSSPSCWTRPPRLDDLHGHA